MNKEQIEADNFFKDKYSDSAYENCFSRYDMVSFAKDYLESKREEIERKAYEAGSESRRIYEAEIKRYNDLKRGVFSYSTLRPLFKTYDQWNEQKQK